jgi:hypothetical protein
MHQAPRRTPLVAVLPALLAMLAGPAAAQGTAPSGWRVQVTPYLWAAGLDGRIRADRRLPTFRVGQSFGEILEDLDLGAFVNAVALRDRTVLMADLAYVDVSRKGGFDTAPPVSGRGAVSEVFATLAAGYRAVSAPGFDLDILGGVRAWQIDAEASVRVAGTPLAGASGSLAWVDPILGFRARFDLAPRLSGLVMADVGGFGLASRGTFQATAVVNYAVTDRLFASAGYRHLAVDYRADGRILDIALTGPVLGLTWRF